jgi:ATP-binding cassette subfamily B protein
VLACTLGLSVLHATRDLAVALVDVIQHMARLAEALETLLQPHDLSDHPEAAPLIKLGARVEFQNVSFGYPDGRRLFDGIDLHIAPGQRIGLVGHSGGGKTTLFALLQRFYDVRDGRILIDGQDVARVTQESLRGAIAVVPQEASLFHRSIMENIRYGRPHASDDEVMEAAFAARSLDFIEALPRGMATMVGDRGVKLSGGQRQRIAIARALLLDPPILILDEATSALDTESERLVQEAIDRLLAGRTVIVIAHRLSTIVNATEILVLDRGRIIERGTHDALLEQQGAYYRLHTLQFGDRDSQPVEEHAHPVL